MITPAKPCPFCGKTPDVNDPNTFTAETRQWASLLCCITGPEVRASYMPLEHWREDAIAAWNERSTPKDHAQIPASRFPDRLAT
jgi:hypothetical protein